MAADPETVNNIQTLGPYTIIFDGLVRANAQDPAGNTLKVIAPYLSKGGVSALSPALGLTVNMVTDASDDPELQCGGGLVAVHGSIPADVVNLPVAFQLGTDGGGFAQPLTATNQLAIDASQLEGTLNVTVVSPDGFFSPPADTDEGWQFSDTYVALSAVNPLGNVVITGLNVNSFPYPYASSSSISSGEAYVTVGDGDLSRIQGVVTVNNATLTVNNAASSASDILTMTPTSLAGWSVPSDPVTPKLNWSSILYNQLTIQAGDFENVNIEGTPTLQMITFYTGYGPYDAFEGNWSVTIENDATSTAPDSVYVMGSNAADILSIAGDYSVDFGDRLNPDGSVTDVGDVNAVLAPVVLDYTGTAGNANVVFDARADTYGIDAGMGFDFSPYIVAPSGETRITSILPNHQSIQFNDSNINFTIDDDRYSGNNEFFITNPGSDTVTYNAAAVEPGSTPLANEVVLENNDAATTINGNGATLVDFSQDNSNNFNPYTGVQADVDINDSSIEIGENSLTVPPVTLTGDELTGATMGNIHFTDPTGFTFQANPATPMTMTVVNTPAGITTNIDITNTILSIQGTTGPLDVKGSEGSYPSSNVTIGDGTLAGIDGNVVVTGFGSDAGTGIITTILDQDAGPASNVVVTSSNDGAETITGLIPATIGFNGQSALNLYTPAGSTDTVYQSVNTFNLYAGAGSTVNLDSSGDRIDYLTILGAAQVNVAQGDPSFIDYADGAAGSLNIEADPARPSAVSDVTINAASIGGYNVTLGDGPEGFESFQFGLTGGTPSTINLQQNTVELTLELPTSHVNHLGLTINDTGSLPTTIDEGAVPTTVAGTTGSLTLESNDPAAITIGGAASVQGISGAVDVLTTTPTSTPTALVVDDSADATSQTATVAPAAGGLYAITGLAPAPIDFTAAQYSLALNGGTAGNAFTVVEHGGWRRARHQLRLGKRLDRRPGIGHRRLRAAHHQRTGRDQ